MAAPSKFVCTGPTLRTMPVLTLNHIHKAFGPQVVLDDVSLTVMRGARIGLIGRNGEGKSTLLKLMAGLVEADGGELTLRSGMRVAYLPQAPHFEAGQSVFAVVASGLQQVAKVLGEYDHALQALEQVSDGAALNRVSRLQAELERSGAWQYWTRIETAISKLNLEAHTDMGRLSGGWQRRVALARAVVAEPDVLLLDEPTNHLDVASIEWLEDFVAAFPGAVVFITHDRYFLDAVAEEIVELDRGRLVHFPCSYAEYLEKKAEMLAIEEKQHARFDKRLAQEERWIRQGIPARRTRNEGRVRNLEHLRQQRAARRLRGGDVELRVASGIKPGRMLIEATGLTHHLGGKIIVRDLDLRIMAGDRIGLVGPNGIGKTTLLNLLLGQMQPDEGKIRHGARLEPAFLEQMRELDPELKLKDVLLPDGGQYVYVAGVHPRHVVGYMQDFLFDKERLHTRVAALSGGECGRLLLARLLLKPANLLVLDEPTNDLDIGTLSMLEHALADYDGTVILVSHDRAFMDRVVSRVLAFEGDGRIVVIEGGWSDYAAWKSRQSPQPAAPSAQKPKAEARTNKPATKLSYKDQRELDTMPERIEALESEKSAIEARFCDPEYFARDADGFRTDQQRLADIEPELAAAYARWEELEARQAALAV
jgi:ABC transport system ATP-binding/permease protein